MPFQEGIAENIMREHGQDRLILYCGTTYELLVHGVDCCGNSLDRGGSQLLAKIAAIGGVVPSKNTDNSFEVVDRSNGTYAAQVNFKVPNDIKLQVSLDKAERAGNGGGELPSHTQCTDPGAFSAQCTTRAAALCVLQASSR